MIAAGTYFFAGLEPVRIICLTAVRPSCDNGIEGGGFKSHVLYLYSIGTYFRTFVGENHGEFRAIRRCQRHEIV